MMLPDRVELQKHMIRMSLQSRKTNYKHIMKQFETVLYEKIKLVYNYHTTGDKLSDDVIFKVDIIEDEPQIDVKSEIEKIKFKLDKNIIFNS